MVNQESDILLTIVPPWDYEKPPLGAACLVTYLKSIGVNIEVMDLNIELYLNSPDSARKNWSNQASFFWQWEDLAEKYGQHMDDFVKRIISYNSKVLGFSVNTVNSIYFLKDMILRIKKEDPDKIIIVGGPGCFNLHERRIFGDDLVNFFVIGKGELALEGLLGKIGVIDSLTVDQKCRIFRDQNGYLCVEGAQKFSLDIMPLSTFEEFNLSLYTQSLLPLLWSMGCIRKCAFCLDRVFSGTYSFKSVSKIIREIKFYTEQYGIKRFRFVDNLINGNLQSVNEFCCQIVKEDISIEWDGQIVVRGDMNKLFFRKLKASGCDRLDLGVESFSDKVLRAMNKGFLAKDAVQNIIDAKSAGLKVSIFIIIGFPGEEEADFNETVENIKRYRKYFDEVGNLTLCCIPFGTDLHNNPYKYNIAVKGSRVLKDFWLKWHTKDNSNNFEIRVERLKKLIKVLYELDIPFKDNLKLVT